MTGEWCQSPSLCDWELRENFTRAPLLSPIDSATSHYCQSGLQRLHGRSRRAAGDCQGSGVQRQREAARLPASHRSATVRGGHRGPLSRGCLGRMPQLKLERLFFFCFTTHNAHGWEARRGETSGASFVSTKGAAEALAAPSDVTVLLEK